MGLFPNKEENKGMKLSPAKDLSEETGANTLHPAGDLADSVLQNAEPAPAPAFVLNIDGAVPTPEKEPEKPVLTGGTGTLPKAEEVRAEKTLVADIEQDVADTVRKAVEAAQSTKQTEKPAPARKAEPASEAARVKQPAASSQEQLANMSYASMAEAVQQARKEPTGRYSREAVDDETLLAELYTLIGDGARNAPVKPAPRSEAPAYEARPAARITPDTLKDLPEEEEVYLEEDSTGAPGWLKGVFILLISLLLSAMTFYAVVSDVIGEIF